MLILHIFIAVVMVIHMQQKNSEEENCSPDAT
jgi:hypothetical protein